MIKVPAEYALYKCTVTVKLSSRIATHISELNKKSWIKPKHSCMFSIFHYVLIFFLLPRLKILYITQSLTSCSSQYPLFCEQNVVRKEVLNDHQKWNNQKPSLLCAKMRIIAKKKKMIYPDQFRVLELYLLGISPTPLPYIQKSGSSPCIHH